MARSIWGTNMPIAFVIYLLLSLSTPPLHAFVEQALNEPASELEELEEPEEPAWAQGPEVEVPKEGMPAIGSQLPSTQIDWPPPEFGVSVLLGRNNYRSLGNVAFPFSPYVRVLFGWLLDTNEDHTSYRLTHGPVTMLHLSLPNLTTLTPMISFGPAYYFIKKIEDDHSHEKSHTIGLMANVGLDLYLTKTFSLLIQQSLMMMESGLEDPDGEEVKSVARSQIMFHFTF